MKAMILAAGLGIRLRPFTDNLAKAVMPVLNIPIIIYIINLLKKYSIKEIMINLHHCPDSIRRVLKDGSHLGVSVYYSYEKELLGTAGGLKKVEDFFEDTFLVINTDIVINLNIEELLKYHRESRSLATMVVRKRKGKADIGFDSNYSIRQILERGDNKEDIFGWGDFLGVHVLEKEVLKEVPAHSYYELNSEVYPLLIKKEEKLKVYLYQDYWIDMGSISNYFQVHKDFLKGKIPFLKVSSQKKDNLWVGGEVYFSKDVEIKPPAFFGNNCYIEKGAKIDSYCIIGNNCKISCDVTLKKCIVWDKVTIERKGAHLREQIIDKDIL